MSDFDTALQEVIDERLTVLFRIERTIFTKRYSLSEEDQEIFATQSIPMIYSLWEGFVQKTFSLYIDELNKLDIRFYDLCDDLIIHHMENSFKQFREYPSKDSKKAQFFKELKGFHENNNHSISRVVNTQSNVSFSVINKLLVTFALEPFPVHWQAYRHPYPDLKSSMDSFLWLRNTVAHGGDLMSQGRVTQQDYGRFSTLVKDLMDEVRVKMLDGLVGKTFR